jgi:hypothetical protein
MRRAGHPERGAIELTTAPRRLGHTGTGRSASWEKG